MGGAGAGQLDTHLHRIVDQGRGKGDVMLMTMLMILF